MAAILLYLFRDLCRAVWKYLICVILLLIQGKERSMDLDKIEETLISKNLKKIQQVYKVLFYQVDKNSHPIRTCTVKRIEEYKCKISVFHFNSLISRNPKPYNLLTDRQGNSQWNICFCKPKKVWISITTYTQMSLTTTRICMYSGL